jgi:flagellar biosynthetic protein FlhB
MGVPFCFNEPLLSSFHSYAHSVYTLGIRIGLFFFILAIFDYMYQRYEYHQNMRMSKHELKQEYKELEGDPFLKQRQQQIRQKLSRSRMMENVKKAKVVITNPTHFACALMYNEELEAPRLVAKGKNLIAKNIIKVAKEHNIPVVENKTLARSLYAHVEIEEIIPPQLYAAVAEVILFVMQLEEEE